MLLEFICDMELAYREVSLNGDRVILIHHYGGEEGTGYGEGDGAVTGPWIQGSMRWVNQPHRRNDGVTLPDAHGIIVTRNHAVIMVRFQGRTVFDEELGRQLINVIFEAEHESYRWLNSTLCVLEGLINSDTLTMRARVYACQSDLI
jgi:hypothetical protein